MTYYIMADGTIKYASDMVGELLKLNGGRKLELKPIELNINNINNTLINIYL